MIILLAMLGLMISCQTPAVDGNATSRAKNVILLIGDGMALPQITLGMYHLDRMISLERFAVVGLHKSHAYDDLITDSAAGATAFSCGVKTYNGAIGVGPDTVAVKTILEMCEDRGMPTGLVATSTIVHATPASFAAHVKSRRDYEDIALDMSDSEVDIMIGGGKKYFDRREDEKDLLSDMQENGYMVSHFADKDLGELSFDVDQNVMYLTADSDPLPVAQGRDYLPQASDVALSYLAEKSGDKGFFLMIEGSQIDWGGHANNQDYVLSEFTEYEKVIGNMLNWAEQDGETLVVVTADHETGGLTINPGSRRDSLVTAFTTGKHTAMMVPVFAHGPGADAFAGIYENTAIFDKLKSVLGF